MPSGNVTEVLVDIAAQLATGMHWVYGLGSRVKFEALTSLDLVSTRKASANSSSCDACSYNVHSTG